MTPKLQDLISTLRQLFLFDRADLDFGLYRIMNARRAEVDAFLLNRLPEIARDRLGAVKKDELERLNLKIREAIQQAESYGVADPDNAPPVIAARRTLAQASDLSAVEDQVYSLLVTFFSRYYEEGDFITRRRRSGPGRERYMIPYDGEEVKLVWANMDQYYIKSDECLRDYRFRLPPLPEGEPAPAPEKDPRPAVLFKLVQADVEKDNRKVVEGERRFTLAVSEEHPVTVSAGGKLLTIPFAHAEQPKGTKQSDLLDAAELAILQAAAETDLLAAMEQQIAALVPAAFAEFLRRPVPNKTDPKKTRTLLRFHLDQYAAKNTYDYFIHKDLGGFFTRELDYFLKSEVLEIEDLIGQPPEAVDVHLRKVRSVRDIAQSVIVFLANLENFQKKLWLKKKFVVETNWCITLDRVPEALYPEIAANKAQWAEWKKLGFLDIQTGAKQDNHGQLGLGDSTRPKQGTVPYLKAYPFMVIDTALYGPAFKQKLLASVEDIDAQTDGLLIHSENFQALNLLQERYREQIRGVYIDPPYNTGNDGFAYKDNYQHSSWMSMFRDRVKQAQFLLADTAGIATSINDIESSRLTPLANELFGEDNYISTLVWNTDGHTDNQYDIKENHEYIQVYVIDRRRFKVGYVVDPNTRKESNLWKGFAKNSITKNGPGNPFSEVVLPIGFPVEEDHFDLPSNSPPQEFFDEIRRQGFIRPEDTQKYAVSYPIRLDPMRVSGGRLTIPCRVVSGWANVDKLREFINGACVPIVSTGETLRFYLSGLGVVYYRKDREKARNIYSVLRGMGTTEQMRSELESMGIRVPAKLYPKPTQLISYLLKVLAADCGISMDFFGGSGTSGHAVINLNREDDGKRKYILVEMGEYFDTVLIPRIQKVVFSKDWKDGKPTDAASGISHCFKYLRLESYEDTLNNLILQRSEAQQQALTLSEPLNSEYLLGYFLDTETTDSPSLLNVLQFADPWNYKLKIAEKAVGESRPQPVDLIETFNYLIGLKVTRVSEPLTFVPDGKPQRDADGRMRVKRLRKADPAQPGAWTFQTVAGTTLAGEKILIVWRTLSADRETDSAVLEAYLQTLAINTREQVFDILYVNGDHTLENLATAPAGEAAGQSAARVFKVRMIETEFRKRMFAGAS